jgi:hypothetical protein
MKFYYKGLELETSCKYFSVKKGVTCSVVEDTELSTLTLTYTDSTSSTSAFSKFTGLKLIGKDSEMEEFSTKKIKPVYLTINGLKLAKLTLDSHIFHLIIVDDSESRVVQTYDSTTIVVSKEDSTNKDFIDFLFFTDNLIYLKPVGPKPKCFKINNFPKLIVKDTDLTVNSDSDTVYKLRKTYNDYLIRSIDYQDQFILELRKRLDDYGVELVRSNKEELLKKTSYVVYQFSSTPTKAQHVQCNDDTEYILSKRIPISFTLRTTDMVMFFDFKNKYENVNLLTNFCEFKTSDKYGARWSAGIKWGPISEDFNHAYQTDDNANFSYQCQFSCELNFYEVFDSRYEILKEIIEEINSTND